MSRNRAVPYSPEPDHNRWGNAFFLPSVWNPPSRARNYTSKSRDPNAPYGYKRLQDSRRYSATAPTRLRGKRTDKLFQKPTQPNRKRQNARKDFPAYYRHSHTDPLHAHPTNRGSKMIRPSEAKPPTNRTRREKALTLPSEPTDYNTTHCL